MGSSSSSTKGTTYAAYYSARSKSSMAKKQKLYPPIISPDVYNIQGVIQYAILVEVECESSIAQFFNVNHAFVIFEMSTNYWIRSEIGPFQKGTTIYIELVSEFNYKNQQYFKCTTPNLTAQTIVNWAIDYYKKGDYDVQHRNCYDYVSFMLQNDFGCGDYIAKRWKENQLDKVPSILK